MSTQHSMTLDTLIIVCCHAIYLGAPHEPWLESSWLIEPFQAGEVPTFISHIEAGIDQLQNYRGQAMLCFSGGNTKKDRTDKSEGRGYLEAAEALGLLSGMSAVLRNQIVCDEWATDSFQNCTCSLMQWPRWMSDLREESEMPDNTALDNPRLTSVTDEIEVKSIWPKRLVIVSHEFKRKRFEELHLPALRWNGEVEYVGIDPPFDVKRMAEIVDGDRIRGHGAWKQDLYGHGKVLTAKREKRGWDKQTFIRKVLERERKEDVRHKIATFVGWAGGEDGLTLFPERMPWEQQHLRN